MAEEKTTDLDKWEKRHPEADILPAAQGPMEIMADAVRRGAGKEILEQLQGMFEFQKKIDADNARKAYYEAMSKFAANPPEIFKTKQVGYEHKDGKGSTSYKHAGLEDVAPKIQAHLSPHGLSASWVPDQTEKGIIKVTCKISHKDGHSESVSLSAPHDVSGKKNAIQAMFSRRHWTLVTFSRLSSPIIPKKRCTNVCSPTQKLARNATATAQ